jgi:hypothetical protein
MGRIGSGLYHGCPNAPKKKLRPQYLKKLFEKLDARILLCYYITNLVFMYGGNYAISKTISLGGADCRRNCLRGMREAANNH